MNEETTAEFRAVGDFLLGSDDEMKGGETMDAEGTNAGTGGEVAGTPPATPQRTSDAQTGTGKTKYVVLAEIDGAWNVIGTREADGPQSACEAAMIDANGDAKKAERWWAVAERYYQPKKVKPRVETHYDWSDA